METIRLLDPLAAPMPRLRARQADPAEFAEHQPLIERSGPAMRHVFKVFGHLMSIERDGDEWHSYLMGPDGKRRPAELAIPSDITHGELAQYLYDIYHESATPTNGHVVELETDRHR